MNFLISLSRMIDALNEKIGHAVSWALLLAVLISAGNALVRYSLNMSSNAWLEIQWYLYGAVFLLAAPYTLKRDEHVRIDVLASRLPKRKQVWMDVFGILFFLFPATLLTLYYSIPYAWISISSLEMSSNAGGLIVWPAKLLIPIGFFLLALQGISELVKRIAHLRGHADYADFGKAPVAAGQVLEARCPANPAFPSDKTNH